MSAEQQTTSFRIALRVWHPAMDPHQITRALGMVPSYSCKVGEDRTTPKGTVLPGKNSQSYWHAPLSQIGVGEIAALIAKTNQQLVPAKQFMHELVASGGIIEYFIGWFVDSNVGEVLDWSLLEQCADLRIRLAFDVYGPDRQVQQSSS